jgi:hypothetical protein
VNDRLSASLNSLLAWLLSPLALVHSPSSSSLLPLLLSEPWPEGRKARKGAAPPMVSASAPRVLPRRTLGTRSTRRKSPPSMIPHSFQRPPVASSYDSDDSMGMSTAERSYIWSIKSMGLGGSDDSEEASSEEVEDSSDSKEGSASEGGDDDDKGDGGSSDVGDDSNRGGDGSGDGSGNDDGGKGSNRGGDGYDKGGGDDSNAGGRVPLVKY